MIRLLLIIIFLLFFLWLMLNLFTSKKNDTIKFLRQLDLSKLLAQKNLPIALKKSRKNLELAYS